VRVLVPEWKYVCVSVDPLAGGRVSLAVDGQPLATRLTKELSANYTRRLDLGQLGFFVKIGSVGLINVFSGVPNGGDNGSSPSYPAIGSGLTSCGASGTVLAWAASGWSYPRGWPLATAGNNSFTKWVAASEVCHSNGSNNNGVLVAVPLHLKVAAAYSFCSRLSYGGQIPAYNNLADWRAAWDTALAAVASATTVDFLWQPFHRQGTSDIFASGYDRSLELRPGMWIPGQPNNLDEKCVLCDGQGCWDKYCIDEQESVSFCHFQ